MGDGWNIFICDNDVCGGCIENVGICDKKFVGKDSVGRGFFVCCVGCFVGDIVCDICGGNDGNGCCKGQFGLVVGKLYEGCQCGDFG